MKRLVDRLRLGGDLGPEDYAALLKGAAEGPLLAYAMQAAREVAVARFGTGIFIRGLIEITNYCRNDCYYCGIRRSNRRVERYRLSREEILTCCRRAARRTAYRSAECKVPGLSSAAGTPR